LIVSQCGQTTQRAGHASSGGSMLHVSVVPERAPWPASTLLKFGVTIQSLLRSGSKN
jgi:hypothetical protein